VSDVLGYHALFAIGAASSLAGIVLLVTTVKDPRRG
jgi:hypothetical protein